MKKKEYAVLAAVVAICTLIASGSALAEENTLRRDNLSSKGILKYADDAVVIDTADLTYLADEIDDLEQTYKSLTVNALNRISTYYASPDGLISHSYSDNGVSVDEAAELSFDDLYKGIVNSQSVDHLADQQAEDSESNPLYYADQEAKENKNLVKTTKDANDYPVLIQAASNDNLSAGTAAWVNGKLLIGNGADNKAYYEYGYAEGWANNTPSGAHIEYVKHNHSDKCYDTIDIKSTGQYYFEGETHYHQHGGDPKKNCYVCTICGSHNTCYNNGHYGLVCGYNEGQILEAHIIYD